MRTLFGIIRSRVTVAGLLLVASFSAGEFARAQLPPEIMVDRYLVQAERELNGGEPAAAVETLGLILALRDEQGLEIPDDVWFKRAQAVYWAGLHDLAVESVVRYLEITGQDGERYVSALELYDAAELAQAEAAERAAEAAAREEALAATLASNLPAAIPEMGVIPAGWFRMGCVSGRECFDDEFPVYDVTIPHIFAVSKYEVTFAQWDACVAGGGCDGYRPDDEGWGRGRRPVINVSWEDAQEYVAWLSRQSGQSYRLLSEAEWEYVARAGSSTAYSWGNDIGFNRANSTECGSQWDDRQTAPSGSFSPNAFAVHDMHGNVWEWVEDCWNDSYAGAPSDGSAGAAGSAISACCVALPGASWGACARRTASGEPPGTGTSTMGSVWVECSSHKSATGRQWHHKTNGDTGWLSA